MFAFKLTDHSLNCKPKNPINNCPALRRAITKQVTDMQASIETISTLERKMTIAVPAERVETQVEQRLNEAARTVQLKGFRKGKVPVKVVKERYGGSVRQEVLGEVMSSRITKHWGSTRYVLPASRASKPKRSRPARTSNL